MNLNHLAIFHAVAEAGSISRGAETLCISQPAVSRQLAELELAQHTRLFDRLPRGVRLTEAGMALYDCSRRLFAVEKEAETVLAELAGLQRGHLRIGASTTIGDYLLPALLAEFHRRYPALEVSLDIGNTDLIQRRLLEGTLEIGFTEGLVRDETLEATVFHEDELISIAPPSHPFARSKTVSVAQFCAEPMLVREAGSGTRAVLEKALSARGVRWVPALSFGSSEAVKRGVMAGAGVAFLSKLAAERDLERGDLVQISLSDFRLLRPLHRLTVRGRSTGQRVRALLALLPARPSET